MSPDAATVRRQLGRAPRGSWRVAARCVHGRPVVIRVEPRLEDGTPFPTLMWLTCPALIEAVSSLESAGLCADWTARIGSEPALEERVRAADSEYRRARAAGLRDDPCPAVGIAGQSDALVVKCIHARVAAALGGIRDPVGDATLAHLAAVFPCVADRCGGDVGAAG